MSDERSHDGEELDAVPESRWRRLPPRIEPEDWIESEESDPETWSPVVRGDGVARRGGTPLPDR